MGAWAGGTLHDRGAELRILSQPALVSAETMRGDGFAAVVFCR